jgi:fumarate hydratase class I
MGKSRKIEIMKSLLVARAASRRAFATDASPFAYSPLFPAVQKDETPFRKITGDFVSTVAGPDGVEFLKVEPEALTALAAEAMTDIAHLLRPAHLKQLRSILDDPESSENDHFVALELLKNANIAAGMVLPGCQDTGTAIIAGKRGGHVLTEGNDEEALSRGVYDTYATRNLRYSQVAPLDMFTEQNTKNNLPAQIELYADGMGDEYKFLFVAKGGGSANKTFLYQQTKALLNPDSLMAFVDEKIRTLGTAACPPYHLAIVIGGLSAEMTLRTVKYASCKYLDTLPTEGSEGGQAFRDVEWEEKILELTRKMGIGAQFGGKHFCHDVRVVRLPRHGASCPVGIGVSCSADRQIKGKITKEGVFLEQLETDPGQYLPDVIDEELGTETIKIDINQVSERLQSAKRKNANAQHLPRRSSVRAVCSPRPPTPPPPPPPPSLSLPFSSLLFPAFPTFPHSL